MGDKQGWKEGERPVKKLLQMKIRGDGGFVQGNRY